MPVLGGVRYIVRDRRYAGIGCLRRRRVFAIEVDPAEDVGVCRASAVTMQCDDRANSSARAVSRRIDRCRQRLCESRCALCPPPSSRTASGCLRSRWSGRRSTTRSTRRTARCRPSPRHDSASSPRSSDRRRCAVAIERERRPQSASVVRRYEPEGALPVGYGIPAVRPSARFGDVEPAGTDARR